MNQLVKEIRSYFEYREAEIKDFLVELVRTETPSLDPTSQQKILHLIRDKFHSIHYSTTIIPGRNSGGYLLAKPVRRIKKRPIQLLAGHCDTVWQKGTLQNMPIQHDDNKLKGPGVFDMKAGLTQMVFALQCIHDRQLKPLLTPVCIINSDEETGSRDSTQAIRRLASISKRAYILEPPLGITGKLKTGRKGLGRFTIHITGRAAHAGLDPDKGVNAIIELSHQIQNLFAMNNPQRGISVNVGMVEGGISPNVIAPSSKAVVDVRVFSKQDAELITRKIYGLKSATPGTTLEISGGFGRMPMERTPRNKKLWEQARDTARLLDLELEEGTAGGGSDGNTTSLYTATLDGLGTSGDGAHASHEFILWDKIIERTTLLTLLILSPNNQEHNPFKK